MRGIIRKIILLTILLVSIGVFAVRNRAWVAKNNPLSQYKCDIPVTYAIGAVDPRFDMSQEKFTAMSQEAERKWEDALGRDVLRMEPDGRVKVNLAYDGRQRTTENLKTIGADIESGKQAAGQSLDDYSALTVQLEQKKNSFASDSAAYEKKQQAYNEDVNSYQKELKDYERSVDYWNSRGGATGSDYDELIDQKKELDKHYEAIKAQENSLKISYNGLEKRRQEVNALVARINALVGNVEQIAGQTNERVAEYNETQAERGEFETGLYTNNNGSESIDIFQFADDKDLLAVLIHEMGHALGLEHAQNQSAIMYPKLVNQSADITPDDVALFQETCVR
ncbi:MAG: matrixin family metalloprotease [Candidatus Moranbacteria bacterium]|nr:matrixin family metalloprotease [Candidatus Moranbacteria bacterium]